MNISVFDLFKIGIGPSSSHTVGPMKAAGEFVKLLERSEVLPRVNRVKVDLYGSLGATGRGHHSDLAILLGLAGHRPENVDVNQIPGYLESIRSSKEIKLGGHSVVEFDEARDVIFRRKSLPFHPNGMIFFSFGPDGGMLVERTYYSVGGGFILEEDKLNLDFDQEAKIEVPYPFSSCEDILTWCECKKMRVSQLMMANEVSHESVQEVKTGLWEIWKSMDQCIERGYQNDGFLPGDLSVRRRAPDLYNQLIQKSIEGSSDPLHVMDWVNLYAISVNEENAAGGRVVTAPTNGAAGIIPAVLKYWIQFRLDDSEEDIASSVERFLLTAGAIGALYKTNASISGAELGCQGEVGVACSMAAGALAELLGGTPWQVENAAEIGMEHNLGLTCDPIGGLVQIPCIERNAMGAVKAINAARMALQGDGYHYVSLDKVIKTMRETGRDMMTKYKETSRGGLAVNVIEC
jgi:L-serine dehydratase